MGFDASDFLTGLFSANRPADETPVNDCRSGRHDFAEGQTCDGWTRTECRRCGALNGPDRAPAEWPTATPSEPERNPRVVRRDDRPAIPWPGAAADFVSLLGFDDLPAAPFAFGPAATVVDAAKFLASLKADVVRGPSNPRAFYGAAQADMVRLQKLLSERQANVS